ncbi:hypothetical protein FGB62_316g01 [Gracilaria domingensis]|nr:hypothetical protein FGB62_316g01 [Gracilaria domingensis]
MVARTSLRILFRREKIAKSTARPESEVVMIRTSQRPLAERKTQCKEWQNARLITPSKETRGTFHVHCDLYSPLFLVSRFRFSKYNPFDSRSIDKLRAHAELDRDNGRHVRDGDSDYSKPSSDHSDQLTDRNSISANHHSGEQLKQYSAVAGFALVKLTRTRYQPSHHSLRKSAECIDLTPDEPQKNTDKKAMPKLLPEIKRDSSEDSISCTLLRAKYPLNARLSHGKRRLHAPCPLNLNTLSSALANRSDEALREDDDAILSRRGQAGEA